VHLTPHSVLIGRGHPQGSFETFPSFYSSTPNSTAACGGVYCPRDARFSKTMCGNIDIRKKICTTNIEVDQQGHICRAMSYRYCYTLSGLLSLSGTDWENIPTCRRKTERHFDIRSSYHIPDRNRVTSHPDTDLTPHPRPLHHPRDAVTFCACRRMPPNPTSRRIPLVYIAR
jgi:hypothetical protein